MLLIVAFNYTDCNTDFNYYKMKKKTPYLDFYKKCMKTMEMPVQTKAGGGGLCEFFNDPFFLLMRESVYDTKWEESYCFHAYWGAGLPYNHLTRNQCQHGFTELRQTIVLLLAAMNGEL